MKEYPAVINFQTQSLASPSQAARPACSPMSSPPGANGQGDPDEKPPSASESAETEVADSVECPNCGHEFAGNYCPNCGQEADPSVSITGVMSEFFWELVDLERGVWPTLVGLTLRPGEVLRGYLSGVRAGLMRPGRYLLTAVVISFGIGQFLAWIGASPPLGSSERASPSSKVDETGKGFVEALEVTVEQLSALTRGSYAQIILALVAAVTLATLLYRLFGDEMEQMGEALGTASYLVAQVNFLGTGAELLYVPPVSLYAGHPIEGSNLLGTIIRVGYVGFACYQWFGPGWKNALKGAFAGGWSFVEAISVGLVGTVTYATGLILLYPARYVPVGSTPEEELLQAAIGALIVAIPLFPRAGVELYHRLR